MLRSNLGLTKPSMIRFETMDQGKTLDDVSKCFQILENEIKAISTAYQNKEKATHEIVQQITLQHQ
jgi:hypothetical protein